MQPFKALRLKSQELLKFIKGVFSKKTLRRIADELISPHQSDGIKAFSAGLGVFIGIMPIWGFQTVAAIFIAMVFRLNKALVIVFSQVSFPPIFPLVLFASYRVGQYWIRVGSVNSINSRLQQYLFGSITLAVAAGILVGFVTYFALKGARLVRQHNTSVKLKRGLQTH